jgi:hypothetical protein
MKLKQNILVDLRLKFGFSFISVLFLFHFTCATGLRATIRQAYMDARATKV